MTAKTQPKEELPLTDARLTESAKHRRTKSRTENDSKLAMEIMEKQKKKLTISTTTAQKPSVNKPNTIITSSPAAAAAVTTPSNRIKIAVKKVVVNKKNQQRNSWTEAPVKFHVKQYGNNAFKPFTVSPNKMQASGDHTRRAEESTDFGKYVHGNFRYQAAPQPQADKAPHIKNAGLPATRPRSSPHIVSKWKDVLEGQPPVSAAVYYSSDKGAILVKRDTEPAPGSALRKKKRFERYFEKMLQKYDGKTSGSGDPLEEQDPDDDARVEDEDNKKIRKKTTEKSEQRTVRISPVEKDDNNETFTDSKTTIHSERQDEKTENATPNLLSKYAHLKFCAGGIPSAHGPVHMSENQLGTQSNLWEIARKRKDAKGKTNLSDLVNMQKRGSGWWWKSSEWTTLIGTQLENTSLAEEDEWKEDQEKRKKDGHMLWPSRRAALGMGLRNIEARTGLTIAGCAGEERILQQDQSLGIESMPIRSKLTRLFNQPIQSSSDVPVEGIRTPIKEQKMRDRALRDEKAPRNMYDILHGNGSRFDKVNDFEGMIRPRLRNVRDELKTTVIKNMDLIHPNKRYATNLSWLQDTKILVQPEPSSHFYSQPSEQYSRKAFVDLVQQRERQHQIVKLAQMETAR